jgi:hypothetical protein
LFDTQNYVMHCQTKGCGYKYKVLKEAKR